jgi:hypothetical protein
MKTNNTDEELLQEIQRIIDKASLTEQIALTELLQRYELAVSVAVRITWFSIRGFRLSLGRNKTSHLSFLSSIV